MNGALGFEGRVVIVTGGGRGVGHGIATRFLEAGAEVVICGRKTPELLPRASHGRQARFFQADVREVEAIDRMLAFVRETCGRLDVLINNAGGSPEAAAATVSPRFSQSIIALNLLAPIWFSQRANAIMQAQADGGAIVNIASVSGTRPSPGTAAYGAAKAGLLNLTQSLAIEWAPKVRVNAIVAGMVRTEQVEQHYGDEAGIARVAATVPMQRLASPDDIAQACLWLASPLAGYVTGAALAVHGGGERPAFLTARE
jgi:NAD(P)-dependent dehydrogenase (short-subunit alcohol dehydrogenase family)